MQPRGRPASGATATAAFVVSDLLAVGVLRGLFEAGVRVPQELAIVAFDGIEAGHISIPALTTIDHSREQLGRLGVETLIEVIRGGRPREIERVLPIKLVVRESCGAVLRQAQDERGGERGGESWLTTSPI